MVDPGECLRFTRFMDGRHPRIREQLAQWDLAGIPERERARRLFDFVRDQIAYEWMAKGQAGSYVASEVLARGRGFCVQKSVLLCALGRAVGIPTALVLCDMQDAQLPRRYQEAMGHQVIHYHGLTAFWLGGRWVKADAALSPEIVARKRFRPVAFDGVNDALHAETTLEGAPHARYVRFHGLFDDLPFERLMESYRAAYAGKGFQVFDAEG